ncbi:hypothetical protein KAZ01_02615, partial [Candidatus Gracilibacteria bacterium]|nr:hypothetical protein [Candidatus Gracilibacteria bacterium]
LRDLSSKVEIYKSIEELPIKQQNIYSNVFNGNKTFVYYNKNGSTKESSRTSITAENLIEYFGVTNFENSSLKETDKANNAGYNFGEVSKAFTEFYHGTALDLIKSGIYDNVVIVGNRSYANAFQVIGGGIINKSILDSVEQIQDDDYIYLDYNSNGEIIESRNQLLITPHNYNQLKSLFHLKHSSIIDFQNHINAYFLQNQELFAKYLNSSNNDIRFFCLVNLIEKEGIDKIKEYYLEERLEKIEEEEKKILLSNISNLEIKDLVTKLFVTKEEVWKESLFENNMKWYEELKNKRETYNKAVEIQSRSLDETVKIGEGILARDLLHIEIKKEEKNKNKDLENKDLENEIEKDKWEKKEISISLDEIIKNIGSQKYVLPAHVGSGKSIWVSELAKKLVLETNYKVKLISASNITKDNIGEIKEEDNTIFIIDAIDEVRNSEVKKELKEKLKLFKSKLIITSRVSEYNLEDNNLDNFQTLNFRPISKEEFIKEKVTDKKIQEDVLSFLEKSNLSGEIGGNPLLLNFICMLAQEKDKYSSIGIKNFTEIENKADLYENIVKLVLYKHPEANSIKNKYEGLNEEQVKEELENDLENLSLYAYNNDILNLKKYRITEATLEKYNILFRLDNKDDIKSKRTYSFIHYSFQEFFLARHLAKNEEMKNNSEKYSGFTKGEEKIFETRDTNEDNWNAWRKLKETTVFYGEILGNKEDYEKLHNFLGREGLLKNDDIYGEGFFRGLEIMNNIKGFNYQKYEKIIISYITSNIFFIIPKIGQFIENGVDIKIKNILNKIFYSLFYSIEDIFIKDELIIFLIKLKHPETGKLVKDYIKKRKKNNYIQKFLKFLYKELIKNKENKEYSYDVLIELIKIKKKSNLSPIQSAFVVAVDKEFYDILRMIDNNFINYVNNNINKITTIGIDELNQVYFFGALLERFGENVISLVNKILGIYYKKGLLDIQKFHIHCQTYKYLDEKNKSYLINFLFEIWRGDHIFNLPLLFYSYNIVPDKKLEKLAKNQIIQDMREGDYTSAVEYKLPWLQEKSNLDKRELGILFDKMVKYIDRLTNQEKLLFYSEGIKVGKIEYIKPLKELLINMLINCKNVQEKKLDIDNSDGITYSISHLTELGNKKINNILKSWIINNFNLFKDKSTPFGFYGAIEFFVENNDEDVINKIKTKIILELKKSDAKEVYDKYKYLIEKNEDIGNLIKSNEYFPDEKGYTPSSDILKLIDKYWKEDTIRELKMLKNNNKLYELREKLNFLYISGLNIKIPIL